MLALGGPNVWFVNDGKGHFTEQALPDRAGGTTGALADVDGDGDLIRDSNYKAYTTLDSRRRSAPSISSPGKPDPKFEINPRRQGLQDRSREDLRGVSIVQRADPDFFYINEGARR